jgi:hypothetical protein
MNKKSTQMNTIVIPELEPYRLAGRIYNGNGLTWTDKEEEIMQTYYGFTPRELLMKYLPNRNKTEISSKAARMGITKRGEK